MAVECPVSAGPFAGAVLAEAALVEAALVEAALVEAALVEAALVEVAVAVAVAFGDDALGVRAFAPVEAFAVRVARVAVAAFPVVAVAGLVDFSPGLDIAVLALADALAVAADLPVDPFAPPAPVAALGLDRDGAGDLAPLVLAVLVVFFEGTVALFLLVGFVTRLSLLEPLPTVGDRAPIEAPPLRGDVAIPVHSRCS